jgi:hypothetical protein
MRLGKEQSAGYVADVESGATEQVQAPATVLAAEKPVPVAPEPVAVSR